MLAATICMAAWVVDGDSLRCSNSGEVRLLGIDTPDYRSSAPCRGHFGDHVCNDRAAKAAKRSLIAIVARSRGAVRVEAVATDRYGRTVAEVWAGGIELSCHQLRAGVARYIARYDTGGRVAAACGRAVG